MAERDRVLSDQVICSRAQCSALAVCLIHWRNPQIHPEGRHKTWAACTDHRGFLTDYLVNRGFPVQVVELSQPGGPA